jgi:hypothetical protein
MYFFLDPSWGGQQQRVPAIKGKTTGSKPRDHFLSLWAFFNASCVLEGYECQSPSNSSELPGHLDAWLPPDTHTHAHTLSRRRSWKRRHQLPQHLQDRHPRWNARSSSNTLVAERATTGVEDRRQGSSRWRWGIELRTRRPLISVFGAETVTVLADSFVRTVRWNVRQPGIHLGDMTSSHDPVLPAY